MEQKQIRHRALKLKTRKDLLILINTLKKEELGEKCVPYSNKQLGYYCNPNNVHNRYRRFQIPKKSGGKRDITAPKKVSFLYLLRYVNLILQSLHEPSEHTMGFVPGKSIVDNARMHKGMNYVFNIDLKDFFPSVERKRICKRLQYKPFCMTEEVAITIAGLCCMRVTNPETNEKTYVLPQGSPASPTLTNAVCDKLDFILSKLAKRFGVNYSRYADDITFSSMHNVYQENSKFRSELAEIIKQQGFVVNDAKTRLNKVGSKQEVTGLIVSRDKVNVKRDYIYSLRNILYIWNKYGYNSAQTSLLNHLQSEIKTKTKGHDLCNVVTGKLMFLKMVKGSEDPTYQKLMSTYQSIIHKQSKNQPKNTSGIIYLETWPMAQFAEQNQCELQFIEQNGKRCIQSTDNSKNKIHIVLLKSTPTDSALNDLEVSYCKDKKGNLFYLAHVPYKSPKIKEKVNLDELIKELDALI